MKNNIPRLLKTEQDKEEFVFWIETLRAKVLPKGRHALENGEGFCCLGVGVACTVETPQVHETGRMIGGQPGAQRNSPNWLKLIQDHAVYHHNFSPILANDSGKWSHPRIANKLWHLYKWELES